MTLAASAIAFVAGLLALVAPSSAETFSVAAPFHVNDLTGRPRSLSDMRGQVVIVSYWATWCAPCIAELAILDRAYRAHHAEGLEVIAVTNEPGLSVDRLARWTKGLALSVAAARPEQNRSYGAIGGALPTTYVIDRAGLVRLRRAGQMAPADLERLLSELLAQSPPRADRAQ